VALGFWLAGLSAGCVAQSRGTLAQQGTVQSPDSEPPLLPIDGLDGPARTVEVSIDRTQRMQVLEGFGASLGWYLERLVGETPAELYPMLFPELGLDILRLRNRFERSEPGDDNLEQEREIVRRASAALGHAPKLLLSSWSPPAALKASGTERCKGNADCTLKRKGGSFVYEEFGAWWRRSLAHYDQIGLAPDFVSVQNEPDFIPPNWEGCKFTAKETADYPGYGTALEAVHRAIASLPKRPRIIGPEVLGIHYHRIPEYLTGLDASLLDGTAHHIYERGNDEMWDWREPGPDSFLDEMEEVAAAAPRPLFQTEFGTDEDKGKDGGFETAWLIHHSLTVEGVSAWLYWELIWPSPGGLVSMKGKTPKPRDQYYSLRHYARFTDPGDVRIGALSAEPGLLASAFEAEGGKRLTVIVLNTSASTLDAHVNVEAHGESTADDVTQAVAKVQAFRTIFRPGHSRRWEAVPASDRVLRLPPRSIATLVLEY
jgi:glucuronoarabinoxylan endo-1,4-beta-xylanase